LWRAAVAATATTARRNKGAWSSLGLGLSLGDILAKYGESLRESSVGATSAFVYGTCSMNMEILSLSLSCVLPLEKDCSTCLELLLQLATRVYLLLLE
jgi:hypothetical protein